MMSSNVSSLNGNNNNNNNDNSSFNHNACVKQATQNAMKVLMMNNHIDNVDNNEKLSSNQFDGLSTFDNDNDLSVPKTSSSLSSSSITMPLNQFISSPTTNNKMASRGFDFFKQQYEEEYKS
eukprot:UN10114